MSDASWFKRGYPLYFHLYFFFILSLPFLHPRLVRVGGLGVPLSDALFLITALTWLFALLTRKVEIRWSYFYWPLAAWAAALVLATIGSQNLQKSVVKLAGELYLIGIAVVTYNVIRSIGDLRRLTRIWLIGTAISLVAGLLGVVSYYAGFRDYHTNPFIEYIGTVPPGPWPRVAAFFIFPNLFINYLSVSLSFVVLATWAGWIEKRTGLILIGGILFVGFFTLSPCLGGLALSAGLWIYLWSKGEGKLLLGRAGLAAGIFFATLFFIATVISILSDHPDGFKLPLVERRAVLSHRLGTWTDAWETTMEYPVFGKGVGLDVADYYFVTPAGNTERLKDAHNTWLSVSAQMGLVGLAAFVAVIVFMTRKLIGFSPQSRFGGLLRAALVLALMDAFFYQSISGSFENARHLWVLFGLIVAVTEEPSFDQEEQPLAEGER